jgi:phosphate transport system permease protein
MTLFLTAFLLLLAGTGYVLGQRKAVARVHGSLADLHSRPTYHGQFVALWAAVPAFAVVLLWVALRGAVFDSLVLAQLPADVTGLPAERLALFLRDARSIAEGGIPSGAPSDAVLAAAAHYAALSRAGAFGLYAVAIALAVAGLAWARSRIRPGFRARPQVERAVRGALFTSSLFAILVTVGIVLSLVFEAWRFFQLVSPGEFLFGLEWSPQTALRADQVGSSGAFGAVPIFAGTLLITLIAMVVAVPVGLLAAIYLSEYAAPRMRAVVKPLLEILAGIPTVVYGFFAALTIAPLLRSVGESVGLGVASESALAAGAVMGIMIIPFVSSLSDDVISAVPRSLREGSLGLGATQSETIRRVILPAALPGIVGACLLAVSRAIGETMIVVMAAGLAANLTANPLEAVTTVTVQIVTLLVGDQEFDSAKTLAAFALGLMLFLVTLVLNVIALQVVRKYQEQYE